MRFPIFRVTMTVADRSSARTLELTRRRQNLGVRAPGADELQTDREPARGQATRRRTGRLLTEVDWEREAAGIERAVEGDIAWHLGRGRKGGDRSCRRHDEI